MLRVKNLLLLNQIRSFGSIKNAGGSLAKRGEAHEEEYFHKQRQQQLMKLKQKKMTEQEFVTERIKKHQEAMEYHKQMIDEYKSGKKIEEVKKTIEKMEWNLWLKLINKNFIDFGNFKHHVLFFDSSRVSMVIVGYFSKPQNQLKVEVGSHMVLN